MDSYIFYMQNKVGLHSFIPCYNGHLSDEWKKAKKYKVAYLAEYPFKSIYKYFDFFFNAFDSWYDLIRGFLHITQFSCYVI